MNLHADRTAAQTVPVLVTDSGDALGQVLIGAGEHDDLRQIVASRLGARLNEHRIEQAIRRGWQQPPGEARLEIAVVVWSDGDWHAPDLAACLDSVRASAIQPRELLVSVSGDFGRAGAICDRVAARLIACEPGAALMTGFRAASCPLVAATSAECNVDALWLSALGRTFDDPLVAAATGVVAPVAPDDACHAVEFRRRSWDVIDGRRAACANIDWRNVVLRRAVVPAASSEKSGTAQLTTALSERLMRGDRIVLDPAQVVTRGRLRRHELRGEEPGRAATQRPQPTTVEVRRAEPPRVTVALATRNRRASLARVLAALAHQSLPVERFDVEIVVDGSTDGTVEMVRELHAPYACGLHIQDHRGLAAARNAGWRRATNPIVIFLDDDTVPRPHCLEVHAEAHARAVQPTAVVGYCPPRIAAPGLWPALLRQGWEDHFRRKGQPGHRWSFVDFVDMNSSVPRQVMQDVGGCDESLTQRRVDWELAIRLHDRGVEFSYESCAVVDHDLDVRFSTALAHNRIEGRSDVYLARRHPQVTGLLHLSRYAQKIGQRGSLRAVAAFEHPAASAALARLAALQLPLLEGADRPRAWRKLTGMLMAHSYVLGMQDALMSVDALNELVRPSENRSPAPPREYGVDELHRVPQDYGWLPARLLVSDDGVSVDLDAIVPGDQWDWDELTRRIAASIMRAAA